MSMFIKGINPPKSCYTCDWYNKVQCPVDVSKCYYKMARHPSCPLISIPTPHGELVDRNGLMDIYADRLTAVAERYSPDSSECGILSGAMKLLAIQPTVIEAEGEDNA